MNASLFKNPPYDRWSISRRSASRRWARWCWSPIRQQPPARSRSFEAAAGGAQDLTYGSPGVGTPHHLSMALVETTMAIELVHVPQGTAGAVQDLLGGQISYMFLPVHVAAQHVRAAS